MHVHHASEKGSALELGGVCSVLGCAAHLSLPTACTTQRSATLRMSLRTIANLAESEDQTTLVDLRRCFSFSSVALVVPRPP